MFIIKFELKKATSKKQRFTLDTIISNILLYFLI
jgi:hypothetical protein